MRAFDRGSRECLGCFQNLVACFEHKVHRADAEIQFTAEDVEEFKYWLKFIASDVIGRLDRQYVDFFQNDDSLRGYFQERLQALHQKMLDFLDGHRDTALEMTDVTPKQQRFLVTRIQKMLARMWASNIWMDERLTHLKWSSGEFVPLSDWMFLAMCLSKIHLAAERTFFEDLEARWVALLQTSADLKEMSLLMSSVHVHIKQNVLRVYKQAFADLRTHCHNVSSSLMQAIGAMNQLTPEVCFPALSYEEAKTAFQQLRDQYSTQINQALIPLLNAAQIKPIKKFLARIVRDWDQIFSEEAQERCLQAFGTPARVPAQDEAQDEHDLDWEAFASFPTLGQEEDDLAWDNGSSAAFLVAADGPFLALQSYPTVADLPASEYDKDFLHKLAPHHASLSDLEGKWKQEIEPCVPAGIQDVQLRVAASTALAVNGCTADRQWLVVLHPALLQAWIQGQISNSSLKLIVRNEWRQIKQRRSHSSFWPRLYAKNPKIAAVHLEVDSILHLWATAKPGEFQQLISDLRCYAAAQDHKSFPYPTMQADDDDKVSPSFQKSALPVFNQYSALADLLQRIQEQKPQFSSADLEDQSCSLLEVLQNRQQPSLQELTVLLQEQVALLRAA